MNLPKQLNKVSVTIILPGISDINEACHCGTAGRVIVDFEYRNVTIFKKMAVDFINAVDNHCRECFYSYFFHAQSSKKLYV